MIEFVLATANPDKAQEIRELLGEAVVLRPRPLHVAAVEETGRTLLENARLKARALVEATGLPAIADDTGLEVEALDGAPGVRSARYSGEQATYADNVKKLLSELENVPDPRAALFRTVAVALWPDGSEAIGDGRVQGRIATIPRGVHGFGYDPVFIPESGDGRTFAEMDSAEKHSYSHRGFAFRELLDRIMSIGNAQI